MNMLIVGGAGYIGGVTTHLALQSGHNVTVVDDLSSGREKNIPEGVTFIRGDIRDQAFVVSIFEKGQYDTVIHLAARILVGESMEQPLEYYANNSVAALYMIDQAVHHGVKRYIFSSTAAVYGAPEHIPLSEEDPTHPVNPYGFSKLITEQLLRSYEITHGLQWTALRYFNVAGAYDGVGPDYPFVSHIIPMLLHKLKNHEPITINGNDFETPDGTCVRDYVHVYDIAKAHLLAAGVMEKGDTLNQPINIGSSEGYSVQYVVDTFMEVTGEKLDVTYGPRRAGDPPQLIASNEKAQELLGWLPEHDLESIIRDHYEWYTHKKSS
jgi:UDP-glucose 4-epimerase